MNRRNWLDLSRKLVDRFDLDYTVAAVQAAIGQEALFGDGGGIFNTIGYLSSLYVLLSNSAMNVLVQPGVAWDPNGSPTVVPSQQTQAITSDPTNPKWSLLVLQYQQVGNFPVPQPSDPINTVYLNLIDGFQLILRDGTPSPTPSYPAVQQGDIVLRGIQIPAGATLASQCTLDFSVSSFALMAADSFDNRLYGLVSQVPYVAIKPSQTFGQSPQKFTYVGANRPSAFPLASGVFNPNDTLLNFQSGAISGGDATSPAFTPSIPSSGNSIVATVNLLPTDTLQIVYGTQGTLSQCQSAIQNQVYSGAGSLAPISPYFKIGYAIITSSDGINVTAIQWVDARNFGVYALPSGEYDAVTGSGPYATDSTIAAALARLNGPSKKILVAQSETINTEIDITQNDITLDFRPGITLSKGTAGNGVHVQATGCRILNGRMGGWSGGTDNAILIDSGANFAIVSSMRFFSNTNDVTDNSGKATLFGNVSES